MAREDEKPEKPRKTKRSVQEIQSFCGWDYLESIVNAASNPRDAALVAALFETGGRVSEVLALEGRMFKDMDGYVVIEGMPILKQYDVLAKYQEGGRNRWLTRRRKVYRTIPLPKSERLVPPLVEYVRWVGRGRLFPFGRQHAHRIVTRIDPKVHPHWFRAQRATQLVVEYGFDVVHLQQFFGWQKPESAIHYTRLGWKGLARMMQM